MWIPIQIFIRIQIFTLMGIRIQIFTLMGIRILLFVTVMGICDQRLKDPPGLHFEPPGLHCERLWPSTALFLTSEASEM
jgi:hypothetical protein